MPRLQPNHAQTGLAALKEINIMLLAERLLFMQSVLPVLLLQPIGSHKAAYANNLHPLYVDINLYWAPDKVHSCGEVHTPPNCAQAACTKYLEFFMLQFRRKNLPLILLHAPS
ncbi:hypothetical protein XENORESO_000880 [Xenotaenia resolanae]|uniref:Uncharacterized protein n=1 Tax=Xenotaenia resolanae TaxID=208358 RepID=A0ABV0WZT4_9TELE